MTLPEHVKAKTREAEWREIRAERAKRVLISITALIVTAILVLQTVTLLLVRHQQTANAPVVQSTSQAVEILLDCTQPTGKCYQAAQAQTAKAINNITSVQVAAAWCAVQSANDTAEKVLACVRPTLARLIGSGR